MCIVHLYTAFLIVKKYLFLRFISLWLRTQGGLLVFILKYICGNKYSSEKYEKNSPTSDNDPPCPRKNPTELISWQPRSVSTFRTRGDKTPARKMKAIFFLSHHEEELQFKIVHSDCLRGLRWGQIADRADRDMPCMPRNEATIRRLCSVKTWCEKWAVRGARWW